MSLPASLLSLAVDPREIMVRMRLYEGPLYTLSVAFNTQTNEKYLLNLPSKGSSRSNAEQFIEFAKLSERLRCPFLLSISGVSPNKPFFFISQYPEKGPLKSLLKNPNSLSGTQKTIVAISIANCLLYCHHRSVFVPSLTSEIVYLTAKGLAKINFTEIDQRPIPVWSAPENSTSPQSDIFLFGFLLYELLSEEIPFLGLNEDDIPQMIQERKRPSISRFGKSNLTNLIQKCWSQSPSNRPTIEEIVKQLECTQTRYPQSNENEVAAFIMKLEAHRKKKNAGQTSPNKSTFITSSFSTQLKTMNSYLAVFKDYENEEFMSSLDMIQTLLQEEDVPHFYQIVSRHLKQDTPIYIQESILQAINTTLISFANYNAFSQSHLLKLLPFDEEQLVPPIFDILNSVFINSPSIVNQSFARTLQLLIKSSPEKSIILFANYAKQMDDIKNPFPIIDVMISNQKVYYHSKNGKEYISTLFFMCFNYEKLFQRYIDQCRPIFCAFLHSEDVSAAKAAYAACFALLDSEFQLPFPQIVSDVADSDLSESAVSIFLKLSNFPISQQLVNNLFLLYGLRKDCFLLLLRIAETEQGAQFMIKSPSWLVNKSLNAIDCLRLFMVILKTTKLREQISSITELPQFLTLLVSSNDSQVKICLGTVTKRLTITNRLLDSLSTLGFFDTLLNSINQKDETVRSLLIDVVSCFAKNGYVEDFISFVQPLISFLGESPKVIKSSFAALIYLSFHDECSAEMRNSDIINYINNIPKGVIPSEQISALISNIQS